METVEKLSRDNLEISMDRESVENMLRPEKESSIERNLSRMSREAIKLEEIRFFTKEKTHRDESNKQATQP